MNLVAVLLALLDGEAGPEGGLVQGCADLADAAANPFLQVAAKDNETRLVTIVKRDRTEPFIKGEFFAGGDDDAVEVNSGPALDGLIGRVLGAVR